MLTAAAQERQLESRYRRVLSFGEVLDESISLYRRHWLKFAAVSAIWLLLPGLIVAWFSMVTVQTSSSLAAIQVGRALSPAVLQQLASAMAVLGLTELVWVVFWFAYTTAIVVTTNAYLQGWEPRIASVLGRTMRAFLPALVGGILFTIGLGVLIVVATLILFIPIVDVLLILAAFVGGILWWTRALRRTAWLKWLIIVGAPWGMPTYFSIAWSMFLVATVVEGRGPIDSIRRSAQLVHGQWFRVFGILTVAWTIVVVLQLVPSALIQLPLMVSALARGEITQGFAEQVASAAAGILAQVVFGSVAPIAYTLIFVDLRNRREGLDIAERVSELETLAPSPAHG